MLNSFAYSNSLGFPTDTMILCKWSKILSSLKFLNFIFFSYHAGSHRLPILMRRDGKLLIISKKV